MLYRKPKSKVRIIVVIGDRILFMQKNSLHNGVPKLRIRLPGGAQSHCCILDSARNHLKVDTGVIADKVNFRLLETALYDSHLYHLCVAELSEEDSRYIRHVRHDAKPVLMTRDICKTFTDQNGCLVGNTFNLLDDAAEKLEPALV